MADFDCDWGMTLFSDGLSVEVLVLHSLAGAMLGAGLGFAVGLPWQSTVVAVCLLGLLAELARDNASSRLFRNRVVYPGMVLGVLMHATISVVERSSLFNEVFAACLGLAMGYAVAWVLRAAGSHVLRREAMGRGDVKLQAMVGAFLGLKGLIGYWVLLFCITLAVGMLWPRKDRMPTGYVYLGAALVTLPVGGERWLRVFLTGSWA